MSDKPKTSDKPSTNTSKNSEQLRESVNPSNRWGDSANFSTPPLTVSERDPIPTEPPKKKGG